MAALDSGFNGQLVSLSGALGSPGQGIQIVNRGGFTIALAVTSDILSNNPRRMWAIIQNTSTTNTVTLDFGNSGTPERGLYLTPGMTYIIDRNTPWTGSCCSMGVDGGASVNVTEAQIAAR